MARVIEANSKPLSYALQNEGTERRVRVTLEELMPAAQDQGGCDGLQTGRKSVGVRALIAMSWLM